MKNVNDVSVQLIARRKKRRKSSGWDEIVDLCYIKEKFI